MTKTDLIDVLKQIEEICINAQSAIHDSGYLFQLSTQEVQDTLVGIEFDCAVMIDNLHDECLEAMEMGYNE